MNTNENDKGAIDFTGIPAGTKKIIISFEGSNMELKVDLDKGIEGKQYDPERHKLGEQHRGEN